MKPINTNLITSNTVRNVIGARTKANQTGSFAIAYTPFYGTGCGQYCTIWVITIDPTLGGFANINSKCVIDKNEISSGLVSVSKFGDGSVFARRLDEAKAEAARINS